MPYKLSESGRCVLEKKGNRWVRKKCYTGKGAKTKARKYMTALNLAHARSRGYRVPPARKGKK